MFALAFPAWHTIGIAFFFVQGLVGLTMSGILFAAWRRANREPEEKPSKDVSQRLRVIRGGHD